MTSRWTLTENVSELERPIIQQTLAAKRIGVVEDIAPIVAFLCHPSARWITGNVTCANGGLIIL
jgi:3-oxoacyl-[acyl-carrier protein] reductase